MKKEGGERQRNKHHSLEVIDNERHCRIATEERADER